MKSGNRSNALLVELLIVVMFFMLAATFLMQMFSAARTQGEKADQGNKALVDAQNIAEMLYAAEDPQGALTGAGFESEDGIWRRRAGNLVMEVELAEEEQPYGILHRHTVSVFREEEQIIRLPGAKYVEGGTADGTGEEVRP